jgi:hypothetical protein
VSSTRRSPGGGAERFDPAHLEGLPAPVERYFRFALSEGQPLITGARITHRGEFRGGIEADWSPFHSVQHVSVAPAAFVWDATIEMAPGVSVRVRDHYLGGRAGMLGKVASLVPVVRQEGHAPELASGALHRYLAERVWLPTSLLPGQGVRWAPIDDSSARATLTDGPLTLSMDVHFAPSGEIERVEMLRYRDVDGTGVITPFEGVFPRLPTGGRDDGPPPG